MLATLTRTLNTIRRAIRRRRLRHLTDQFVADLYTRARLRLQQGDNPDNIIQELDRLTPNADPDIRQTIRDVVTDAARQDPRP
jgi:hypothetical protein